MAKMLLAIDVEYDFLDGGKLGVDGSTEMIDKSVIYVTNKGNEYAVAVASVDWHTITHCSFKENGGEWPSHGIQNSKGASIYEPLLMALNYHTNHFEVLTKGLDEDHEEYSIFKNKTSCERLKRLVEVFDIDEIDVFGIAYDYCVLDSLKDGLKVFPHIKFNVLKDFCPSIGDGIEATKFIENSERIEFK